MSGKNKEDLDFALKTERALKQYEREDFKKKSAKNFLKEIKKW